MKSAQKRDRSKSLPPSAEGRFALSTENENNRSHSPACSYHDRHPLYELLTSHLLPLLHPTTKGEEEEEEEESQIAESQGPSQSKSESVYHVLFTSHHLVSPTKRRNLQRWSSEHHLDGFAKRGYPGIIYAQGSKDGVEAFAENVKAMPWKALKTRFLEPLDGLGDLSGWSEVDKVGQVVEVMRKMGRGRYVTEMGIGGGNDYSIQ